MIRSTLIIVAAAILSFLAIMNAIGGISKVKAPELAQQIFPMNGFAASSLAQSMMRKQVATNKDRFPEKIDQPILDLALSAYLSEPTASGAVTILALGSKPANKMALMQHSIALSRRESMSQSWMILENGRQENLAGVLEYYDYAIRTSANSELALLPYIVSALAQANSVEPFEGLLLNAPPWAGKFWFEGLKNRSALQNAVKLRLKLIESGLAKSSFRDEDLLKVLAYEGYFEDAQRLYTVLGGKDRSRSELVRNSDFLELDGLFPFDWQTFSTGDYGAGIDLGELRISGVKNSAGTFARQLIKMPEVDYLYFGSAISSDIDRIGRLIVQISCAEEGKTDLPRTVIRLTAQNISEKIERPNRSCSYFWLDLVGSSLPEMDYEASITKISLSVEPLE